MSKQNAKVYPDDLVIRRVHYWSAGALRQGKRLMALIASQSKYGNTPSQWTPDQAREQHEANSLAWDHLVEELEGDFLVHAVRQLLLWLEQARAHGALSSADIDAFENDTPHVLPRRISDGRPRRLFDGHQDAGSEACHQEEGRCAQRGALLLRGQKGSWSSRSRSRARASASRYRSSAAARAPAAAMRLFAAPALDGHLSWVRFVVGVGGDERDERDVDGRLEQGEDAELRRGVDLDDGGTAA